LSPILIQFYKYNFEYYFGTLCVILYVNVIVFGANVIERLLSDSSGSKLARWLPAISLLFLGVLTQLLSANSTRQSLVFGPNVYYRIIGTIFLLHLVLFRENYTGEKGKISLTSILVTIISLLMALSIMIKTGSRGAIIVGIMMLISFLYSVLSIKIKWLKISIIVVISSFASFIFQSGFSASVLDSRAFWFYDRGASSSSLATRGEFLNNFLSFFAKDNYLLGEGSDYIYSYPHNLYLDLLYNGGIFPFLALVVSTVIYGIILLKGEVNRRWKILSLLFLPIYIGSMFSGTIYNNYPIITMFIMFPFLMQNQVISKDYRNEKSL
jgi:O-antigen ligase